MCISRGFEVTLSDTSEPFPGSQHRLSPPHFQGDHTWQGGACALPALPLATSAPARKAAGAASAEQNKTACTSTSPTPVSDASQSFTLKPHPLSMPSCLKSGAREVRGPDYSKHTPTASTETASTLVTVSSGIRLWLHPVLA